LKRVSIFGPEPTILRDFQSQNPRATWDEFKNQPGSERVFERLSSAQGHICAYCEIEISRPLRGQVEHYQPKSLGTQQRNLHLDFSNFLACCEGGTLSWDHGRSEEPLKKTVHCGALKGSEIPDGRMVDPRALAAAALPWRTTSQGVLVTSPDGCASAGVDPALAESTVTFLGLNRRVLVRLRAALLDKLLEDYAVDPFDPAAMLLPDGRGRLLPFWSTVREFGGSHAEAFVAANADRIPGLGGSS
jgi:uncharacterized protein (TIGR02646 family)